jgi:hypothetical protein
MGACPPAGHAVPCSEASFSTVAQEIPQQNPHHPLAPPIRKECGLLMAYFPKVCYFRKFDSKSGAGPRPADLLAPKSINTHFQSLWIFQSMCCKEFVAVSNLVLWSFHRGSFKGCDGGMSAGWARSALFGGIFFGNSIQVTS